MTLSIHIYQRLDPFSNKFHAQSFSIKNKTKLYSKQKRISRKVLIFKLNKLQIIHEILKKTYVDI